MPNYIFYDIKKVKTQQGITGVFNHNERQKDEYLSNPNINREYTNQNYHLKTVDCSYSEFIKRRIEDTGAKIGKRSVLMLDGVISPSPEWINQKSFKEQIQVFSRAYEFVVYRFTYPNIVSAVVHMDEQNPHMHFDVVPITEDNRLCCSDFYLYPDGGNVEQSLFYEYMHGYYRDISRGIPSIMTQRDHMTMKYFKAAPDYFDMHEIMVKSIETIDSDQESIDENKKWAIALYSAVSKMAAFTIVTQRAEIEYYKEKKIPNLYKEIEQKDKMIEELEAKVATVYDSNGKDKNNHKDTKNIEGNYTHNHIVMASNPDVGESFGI